VPLLAGKEYNVSRQEIMNVRLFMRLMQQRGNYIISIPFTDTFVALSLSIGKKAYIHNNFIINK
jgi:predicted transcriptional regulator